MKLSHIFKAILLLLLPCFLLAQYPNNPVKSRLGWQTTGDGLVYRGSGAPAYSPGTLFNAWMYLDTTNYALYMYRNFQWTKLPLVNNGLTLDGSYVQLGGTLVENTQVERSTYTLDFGKISGTNFGYASFYGTDPHYFGVLTKKDGTESGLTIGNKLWGFEVDDSDHTFQLNGSRFGFDATYLGTLGVSQFKMDSTNFFIRGLPSFASHAAADAGTSAYQMYMIDNSRRIYVNQGTATSDILGTGTATRIPIWTSTNALGDSPILYNSTTKRTTWDSPGVIELPMGTDAQRPSPATTSDFWYNTTSNGIEWYNGTRWAKGLESTFNRGTATRVPFFNANGQITDDSRLTFSSGTLNATTFVGGGMQIYGNAQFFSGSTVQFFNTGNTASASFQFANAYNLLTINRGIVISDLNPNVPGGPISANWPASNMLINGGRGTGNSTSGDIVFATATALGSGTTVQSLTDRWWIKHTTGRLSNNNSPSYILDVQGTDAIRVPVGTVAQTPSEAVGIFRYNSDSTAYQGYAGSTRIFFATRAYARSLVSALPTTNIYTANGTLTGNRTLTGGAYNLTLDTKVKIGADSSFSHNPATNTTTFKGAMNGDSASISITGYGNGNPVIVQVNPAFKNGYTLKTFVSDNQFGTYTNADGFAVGNAVANDKFGFQWDQVARYDSVNSEGWVQDNIYGANFLRSSHYFRGGGSSIRGGEFNFLTRLTASSTPSLRVYNAVVDFFSVLANGQTIVKNRITGANFFLTDPIGDSTIIDGKVRFQDYGAGTEEAADLSKTQSNYIAGFATDGTVLDLERKRDTTVYVVDTDLDWSAAITTAQISRRYNRVIFLMTTTAAAGSDSDLTLHTPDVNLMQVEYLIRSTDEAGGFANVIRFGTNNAVDSTNGLVSSYFPAAGQGVGIRAGLRSGVYKYWYY